MQLHNRMIPTLTFRPLVDDGEDIECDGDEIEEGQHEQTRSERVRLQEMTKSIDISKINK